MTNNTVWAGGARVHGGVLGHVRGELAAFYLTSAATLETTVDGKQIDGDGVYVRGSIDLGRAGEAFVIAWKGTDFISHEGDHNYGSVGWKPGFYQAEREDQELGYVFKRTIEAGIELDLEARLHNIEDELEYSYRVMVKVPLSIAVKGR